MGLLTGGGAYFRDSTICVFTSTVILYTAPSIFIHFKNFILHLFVRNLVFLSNIIMGLNQMGISVGTNGTKTKNMGYYTLHTISMTRFKIRCRFEGHLTEIFFQEIGKNGFFIVVKLTAN